MRNLKKMGLPGSKTFRARGNIKSLYTVECKPVDLCGHYTVNLLVNKFELPVEYKEYKETLGPLMNNKPHKSIKSIKKRGKRQW